MDDIDFEELNKIGEDWAAAEKEGSINAGEEGEGVGEDDAGF